jgi:hypothetical protein
MSGAGLKVRFREFAVFARRLYFRPLRLQANSTGANRTVGRIGHCTNGVGDHGLHAGSTPNRLDLDLTGGGCARIFFGGAKDERGTGGGCARIFSGGAKDERGYDRVRRRSTKPASDAVAQKRSDRPTDVGRRLSAPSAEQQGAGGGPGG